MREMGRGSIRVNLRIPADTHAVIKRLAAYEGIPVNEVVQRVVDAMRPELDQLAAAIDQAERVQTVEQGVEVLDQLRAIAAHARQEADRLDNLVDVWQEEVRQAAGERSSA